MIEDDEIFLLKISKEDQNFYCDIYTDKGLLKYIVNPLNIVEAKKSFEITLKKMLAIPPKLMLFTINSKHSKDKLGIIGIKWDQGSPSQVELGVIVVKKYQRQSIAYSAKSLLIQHVFEKLQVNNIIATCDNDNRAANHSFRKLGFVQMKLMQQNKTKWVRVKK